MTDSTHDASAAILDALADRILSEDAGLDIDDMPALMDLLTAKAFMRLCIRLDLCPYHHCDIDTCNDDGRDCSDNLDLFDN